MTEADLHALNNAWNGPGGRIIKAMLDEQISGPREELHEVMARKPDTLTGKGALRLAIRSKALEDFKQSVEDELEALNPKGQG